MRMFNKDAWMLECKNIVKFKRIDRLVCVPLKTIPIQRRHDMKLCSFTTTASRSDARRVETPMDKRYTVKLTSGGARLAAVRQHAEAVTLQAWIAWIAGINAGASACSSCNIPSLNSARGREMMPVHLLGCLNYLMRNVASCG